MMAADAIAAALEIEDNLLWCRNAAIALGKNVLHLLGTRIAGNQVLGCLDTAIEATGMGLPGSSLAIDANRLNVNGNGIACGVDSGARRAALCVGHAGHGDRVAPLDAVPRRAARAGPERLPAIDATSTLPP